MQRNKAACDRVRGEAEMEEAICALKSNRNPPPHASPGLPDLPLAADGLGAGRLSRGREGLFQQTVVGAS